MYVELLLVLVLFLCPFRALVIPRDEYLRLWRSFACGYVLEENECRTGEETSWVGGRLGEVGDLVVAATEDVGAERFAVAVAVVCGWAAM